MFKQLYFRDPVFSIFMIFSRKKRDMDVVYQLGEEEAQIFIKNVNT